jgi:hypothetical protein
VGTGSLEREVVEKPAEISKALAARPEFLAATDNDQNANGQELQMACPVPMEAQLTHPSTPVRKLRAKRTWVKPDYVLYGEISHLTTAQYCLASQYDKTILRNVFLFNHARIRQFEQIDFCSGARRIWTLPNAGGNSVNSEVLSFEVLQTMFNAELVATEMELEYWPMGSKITDYSVRIAGEVFGVSVTRAMKFNGIFNEQDAERLLMKKLYGVVESTKAVLERFQWDKQILHIWAEHDYIYDILERVYSMMPTELQSNTLVLVTVCPENQQWIF